MLTPTAPAVARPAGPGPSSLDLLKARPKRPGEASFFFYDTHFGSDAVKVLPGEHFVHGKNILITTTLGSCIAACLWDKQQGVGGMNHFMLPEVTNNGPDGNDNSSASIGGRYGSYAMELLINELIKRGARRSALEAKVFGGGSVVCDLNSSSVGERNTRFVLEYLRTERITVVSKDVLDMHARKVCFFPASGKAMVKRLASINTDQLVQQERAAVAAAPAAGGGSVDLF